MNAQKAKQITIANRKSNLKSILEAIELMAQSGKDKLVLSELYPLDAAELKSLGYKVDVQEQEMHGRTSGYVITISW